MGSEEFILASELQASLGSRVEQCPVRVRSRKAAAAMGMPALQGLVGAGLPHSCCVFGPPVLLLIVFYK